MLVALTGTPGTGKTSVAGLLRDRGYEVIDLNKSALENDFILGEDEERDTKVVDIDSLNDYIAGKWGGKRERKRERREDIITGDEKSIVILEGHISHALSVDLVIVLRCRPDVLKTRLSEKGWSEKKIEENAEAEALDVITVESVEDHGEVFEIDTTEMDIEETARSVIKILQGRGEVHVVGKIDWSDYFLK